MRLPASGPTICVVHSLSRLARKLLPYPNPFGIFFSSIEMANSPTFHAVVFRVGDLICAAPAGIVREILPPLPATRIPGVAGAVEGLVNMRGILLTVVDAHRLLGRQRRETDEAPIIVLDVSGKTYGLMVGEVRDFVELPAAAVAPRSDLPGIDPRLVKAVGVHDGRHFILLDIDALVAPIIGS